MKELIQYFDPFTGDLRFLLVMDNFCKEQGKNIQDILKAAEDNIKKVGGIPTIDIARL